MIFFDLSENLEFVTLQKIIHYIVLEKSLKMLFQTCKLLLLGLWSGSELTHQKLTLANFSLWFLKIKTKDLPISILISFKIKIQTK